LTRLFYPFTTLLNALPSVAHQTCSNRCKTSCRQPRYCRFFSVCPYYTLNRQRQRQWGD